MADGAYVEIVEPDHSGGGVLPLVVRVNGTDVGMLAEPPTISAGDSSTCATVTLVLVPRRVEIKPEHDHEPVLGRPRFGFRS